MKLVDQLAEQYSEFEDRLDGTEAVEAAFKAGFTKAIGMAAEIADKVESNTAYQILMLERKDVK